jgi:hypothetical protein
MESSQKAAAAYIETIAIELAAVAKGAKLDLLGYVLEMAVVEAFKNKGDETRVNIAR